MTHVESLKKAVEGNIRCGRCYHMLKDHINWQDHLCGIHDCACHRFVSMQHMRHIRWMRVAYMIADHSKCVRAHYGTLILNDRGHIVGGGFNGKPQGSSNDYECYREGLEVNCQEKPDCCIHSEINAICFSNRHEREGGTFYVCGRPCERCMLQVKQSGVRTLVCVGDDERHYPGLEILKKYQDTTVKIDDRYYLHVVELKRAEVFDPYDRMGVMGKYADLIMAGESQSITSDHTEPFPHLPVKY